MRLALAQINTTVGDLDGNRERILARLDEAQARRAPTSSSSPSSRSPAIRPRTCCSAPASSRRPSARLRRSHARRAASSPSSARRTSTATSTTCAPCCAGGEVKALYRKRFLPNYGVFDEHRYFAPGRDLFLLEHGDVLIGPTVCEDIWQPGPPATDLALAGAQLIVNISASPFHVGKEREREQMLADARARQRLLRRVRERRRRRRTSWSSTGTRSCSTTRARCSRGRPGSRRRCSWSTSSPRRRSGGGCATCAGGRSRASAEAVPRAAGRARWLPATGRASARSGTVAPLLDDLEQMRLALELGLRDYVDKNGFRRGRRRASPAGSTRR